MLEINQLELPSALMEKKVYVGNQASNNVSIIDSATNEVIASVDVGAGPHGIAIIPDGKKFYVANYDSNNVSVIDADTNTRIGIVDYIGNPWGIAVTPDESKVYVTKLMTELSL